MPIFCWTRLEPSYNATSAPWLRALASVLPNSHLHRSLCRVPPRCACAQICFPQPSPNSTERNCLTAYSAATRSIPTGSRQTWTSWSVRRICLACPPLLAQAADRCGARVLQAIQHETSACYFVLAKDDGRQVGFLNPDCCSDYRRQGRLWLRADAILAARRSFKNFYVPSVPDEFIYYLIKKVLKQSMDGSQMRRLHGLYQRAPHDCGNRLHRFWSAHTTDALTQALIEQDLFWFASNSELLFSELAASRPVERTFDRFASTLRRVAASLRRVLQPTGMCVIVSGQDKTHVWNVATALQQSLEPAFRWTTALHVTSEQSCRGPRNNARQSRLARYLSVLKLFRLAIKIRVARMRSTLAICAVDHGEFVSGGRHRLLSMCMRLMFRPDLVLVLTSGHPGSSNAAPGQRNSLLELLSHCPVSYVNESLSIEESVYQASRVILQWLSTRQVRRLSPDKGPSTPSKAPF